MHRPSKEAIRKYGKPLASIDPMYIEEMLERYLDTKGLEKRLDAFSERLGEMIGADQEDGEQYYKATVEQVDEAIEEYCEGLMQQILTLASSSILLLTAASRMAFEKGYAVHYEYEKVEEFANDYLSMCIKEAVRYISEETHIGVEGEKGEDEDHECTGAASTVRQRG